MRAPAVEVGVSLLISAGQPLGWWWKFLSLWQGPIYRCDDRRWPLSRRGGGSLFWFTPPDGPWAKSISLRPGVLPRSLTENGQRGGGGVRTADVFMALLWNNFSAPTAFVFLKPSNSRVAHPFTLPTYREFAHAAPKGMDVSVSQPSHSC